jgi:hypothetical protein
MLPDQSRLGMHCEMTEEAKTIMKHIVARLNEHLRCFDELYGNTFLRFSFLKKLIL